MKLTPALPLLFSATLLFAADNEIGFVEKFALAPQREAVLGQLIPGSEDFYFYQALNAQNSGKTAELKSVMEQWAQRFPQSDRRRTVENRAALLGYERDPQATLQYLRERLNLEFSHEQAARDRKPDLPSTLAQAQIAREVFQEEALQADDLNQCENASLEALVRDKVALRPPQVRALLARIKRPDVPGILDLVEAGLRARESRGFGEFPIHQLLLPEHLDELARRIPALFDSQPFVFARLRKLLPSADADLEYDPAEREAWLERSWAYVAKLPPSFNTLKASILFQRLQLDRTRGIYDKARFVEYLKLPRRTDYVNPRYAEQAGIAAYPVDLNANFSAEIAPLPPISTDEWLVRDYLLRLLRDEPSWEPWAAWLRDSYVKPIFAEAKIVNGIGNPEQWASLLTPSAYQALKDRVDVDFSAASPRFLAPGDDVNLDLIIKNVPKLIVKLYEVNTLSFFLTQKRQLNTDLNLDGLVANQEATHAFAGDEAGANPFRRVPRIFDFPELKGRRGAWVVEFIGGGKSSRALIRKGQWHRIQQTGPAGDLLTILDETFAPVKDAVAWIDGRKLAPDEKTGFIAVPFTKQPGPKPIILADPAGGFATLTQFEHHGESYRLDAQFHLEREQLLARREATLAVRASLLLGDAQVAVGLLHDVRLTLTTRTLDGVTTTKEIKEVTLDAAKDFTHTFPVPDRVADVQVTLAAKVENLSDGGTKQDVTATHHFSLNGIDKTPLVADAHLSKFGGSYTFELLGKNGEPLPDQAVHFIIRHREFGPGVNVEAALSTDAKGRIQLGALAAIRSIEVHLPNGRNQQWDLQDFGADRPGALHGRVGDVFHIPWMTEGKKLSPADVSLLEKRGNTFVKDHFAALSLTGGFLEAKGLPAGDYSLFLRGEGHEMTIRVTAGTAVRNWLVSPNRHLEVRNPAPLQIETVRADGDALVVQLRNANRFTRLHVAAARFLPGGQRLAELGKFARFEPGLAEPPRRPNLFAAGRAIGDEYRYILERRYSKTYPGNMLTRPGLLLNPWEVRSTDLNAQEMSVAEALKQSAGDREMRRKAAEPQVAMNPEPVAIIDDASANLDFLATAAPTLYNLTPGNDGVVRIDRKALGDRQYVQLYAEDLTSAVWRAFSLPEVPTKFQDLRLARGLDPAKPFAEKKEVAVLDAGQSLTLTDILTSDLETYDTLAAAHSLLSTIHGDANFAKFAFILQWPKLSDEEKRGKYSEFACHELNFFLSRKDPAFFQAIVQPYLRNKKDKTFMDEYLIGADLKRYLEPWSYGRLNVVERCLLAQRIPGEAPVAARHLRELWELLPPNPDAQDHLFETALRGRALSEEETVGFKGEQDKANRLAMPAEAPAPALMAAGATPMPAAPRSMSKNMGAIDALGRTAASRMEDRMPGAAPGAALGGAMQAADEVAFFGVTDSKDAQRLRGAVRQYFRELGPTKEWAENNYYQLPLAEQNAEFVTVNGFWRDYAAWDGKAPFLSEHLTEASRNFTEMMLALAVLDLPFEAAKHTSKTEGGAFTLTAGSPLLAFHKQIKPADVAPPDEAGPGPELLVSENFFRADDRYREEGNEKFDKDVTEEFLSGVLYGANVVVTNPRSSPQKLELLLQIPQGALPANGSKATDSRRLRLEPFTTQTFEYYFYFPASTAKPFPHYAVHVARNGHAAGAARPLAFKVVKQLSVVDKTSWDYISQYATEAEVFAFLEKQNLARLDFELVAWRARKDAKFFRRITTFLAQQHVWSEPIFRYAVLHNDAVALRELLRHREDFLGQCGPFLASKLITIDPIERRSYEHLEYSPLVNQRTHRVGAENKIPNPIFRAQYQHLLDILAHKPALSADDELSVVYYLFLQDRIEEALARFHTIKPESLPTRLQYDYLRCYAALYEEQTADARKIAASYASYPVDRWRKLFTEVTAQLDDVEGKARPAGAQQDRDQQLSGLAESEPSFDFKVENRTIALAWKNFSEVTINYYLMDPEFLFSASPFVTQDSGRFSIIKPTQSAPLKLPAGKTALDIPLPAAFTKANVLVEILGAGQRKAQPHHANTLKLALIENYGRLELRDSPADQPVSKAYVKVYARLKNGTVRFFKDGYTDLRGRFDYASLNSSTNPQPIPPRPLPASRAGASGVDYAMLAPSELDDVERLSLLVMSETHGAAVREVSPPSR
ncbi:MAG: hypothetical protein WCF18_01495 [Chthoniobacteraceae bacterium]